MPYRSTHDIASFAALRRKLVRTGGKVLPRAVQTANASASRGLDVIVMVVIFRYNQVGQSMYITTLRKVGGSIMLAVPPASLDLLRLGAGTEVGLAVEGGHLVVQPQTKPRYTLDELLAQCDPSVPVSDDDRAGLDVQPVGHEL